jgi:hypothetical protein
MGLVFRLALAVDYLRQEVAVVSVRHDHFQSEIGLRSVRSSPAGAP